MLAYHNNFFGLRAILRFKSHHIPQFILFLFIQSPFISSTKVVFPFFILGVLFIIEIEERRDKSCVKYKRTFVALIESVPTLPIH
jgi:hypothetical protein